MSDTETKLILITTLLRKHSADRKAIAKVSAERVGRLFTGDKNQYEQALADHAAHQAAYEAIETLMQEVDAAVCGR